MSKLDETPAEEENDQQEDFIDSLMTNEDEEWLWLFISLILSQGI